MAYRGINAETEAWNIMTSRDAAPARTTMPQEKTSRLPRSVSCRGRKPSEVFFEVQLKTEMALYPREVEKMECFLL